VFVLAFFLHRYVERPGMDWARKLTLNAPASIRR
jgi:peptidoglycan/LPS O-acetylase OafA/YrhL